MVLPGSGSNGDENFQNVPLILPKDMPNIPYKNKVRAIPNLEVSVVEDVEADAHAKAKTPAPDDMVTFYYADYHVKILEQMIEVFRVAGKRTVLVADTPGAGQVVKAGLRCSLQRWRITSRRSPARSSHSVWMILAALG